MASPTLTNLSPRAHLVALLALAALGVAAASSHSSSKTFSSITAANSGDVTINPANSTHGEVIVPALRVTRHSQPGALSITVNETHANLVAQPTAAAANRTVLLQNVDVLASLAALEARLAQQEALAATQQFLLTHFATSVNTHAISNIPGAHRYIGGVHSSLDGRIYMVPGHQGNVLILDPKTLAVDTSTLGGLPGGSTQWTWPAEALDGSGKIVAAPADAETVLIVDVAQQTVDVSSITGLGTGTHKWLGTVAAPSGALYGIPYNADCVLRIDLSPSPSASTPSSLCGLTGSFQWEGGTLVGNKIYCTPRSRNQVLVIDTSDDSVQLLAQGPIPSGVTNKWCGGGVVVGSTIYLAPQRADKILRIDTSTTPPTLDMSLDAPTVASGGELRYCQMVKGDAAGRFVYGMPQDADDILVIDTALNVVHTIPGVGGATDAKYQGGVHGGNGVIYIIPHNLGTIAMFRYWNPVV